MKSIRQRLLLWQLGALVIAAALEGFISYQLAWDGFNRSRDSLLQSIAYSVVRHGMRQIDSPMRLGMGKRHARREHECGEGTPVDRPQIRRADAARRGLGDRIRIVVPGRDVGAAGGEGFGRGQPRATEAEKRDLAALEGCDDHRITGS